MKSVDEYMRQSVGYRLIAGRYGDKKKRRPYSSPEVRRAMTEWWSAHGPRPYEKSLLEGYYCKHGDINEQCKLCSPESVRQINPNSKRGKRTSSPLYITDNITGGSWRTLHIMGTVDGVSRPLRMKVRLSQKGRIEAISGYIIVRYDECDTRVFISPETLERILPKLEKLIGTGGLDAPTQPNLP